MNIGATIRELRKRKGLSQGEFGDLVGITQTSMSQIETSATHPRTSTLKKIAKNLDIPEQFIYLLSLSESDISKKKREAYKIIFPSVKQMLFSIIDSDHKK